MGEESEFPIRFVISLTVSEILANYCSKRQKDVLFSQGMPGNIEKLCKQVSRGNLGWGSRIFNQFFNIFDGSSDIRKLQLQKAKNCFFPRGMQIGWKKNHLSEFIEVVWGGKSKSSNRFGISLAVLEL